MLRKRAYRIRKPGLAVTRRAGESVEMTLPDGQTITVIAGQVKGQRMRWHILAPADVKLLRGELKPLPPAA